MEQQDDIWEYVAPQYVDFGQNPLEMDDNADAWFDAPSIGGIEEEFLDEDSVCNGIDVIEDGDQEIEKADTPKTESRRLTRSFASTPNNEKGLPEATGNVKKTPRRSTPARCTPSRAAKAKQASSPELSQNQESRMKDEASPAVVDTKTLNNICTDLSEWRAKCKPPKTVKTEVKYRPDRVKKVPVTGANAAPQKMPCPAKKSPRVPETTQPRPAVKSKQPDSTKPEPRGRSTLKRSASLRTSADSKNLSNSLDRKSNNSSLKRTSSLRRSGSQNLASANTSSSSVDSGQKRNHTRGWSVSRTNSSSQLRGMSTRSDNREDHDQSVPASKMPKLTIPNTPTFLKRTAPPKVNGEQCKKMEERELETIAMLRNELAKKRKLAQESYKKSKTGPACVPVHSHKMPTMPQEFQFQTDTRVKSNHGMETRNGSRERDFADSLRSGAATASTPNQKGPTIPQPFKLGDCRKRKMGSTEDLSKAGDSYQSMAEKVKAFHRQTPERYKTRGRVASSDRGARGRSKSPKGRLTVPKTPQLETRGRLRNYHIPSQQDKEEEEIQEMIQKQFKAHPVNERILTNPNTGVRKVASRPLTEPQEFQLSAADKRERSTDEDKFEFHAKPVSKKMLEGPVGLKPVKAVAPTIPKSPAFALKNRVRIPAEMDELQDESQMKVKAHPVPHSGIPFHPKLGHRCTVPSPFTFEERDQSVRTKKEEKIKEIFEEEKKAREFQAQDLPSPTSDTLPSKQMKPATRPQPFSFEADNRGAKRAEEWRHKVNMEEELREQRLLSSFKATQSDVLIKEPFIPTKSTKPLTDVHDFELNTNKRSRDREYYDQRRKAQEAEGEALKRQREKRQDEEEHQAIAKLRAEMVPKSHPVKRFKNVDVLPSERAPTIPMSPKFSTDSRLRSNVRV